jgi:hypothetical protein
MGKIGSAAHRVSVMKKRMAEETDVHSRIKMRGWFHAILLPPVSTTRRKEVTVVASKNAPVKSILENFALLVSDSSSWALWGTRIQTRKAEMAINGAWPRKDL